MITAKVSKRTTQAIKTKKKIYDISIKLIKKHGFENVTIEDISKKADVSVGAFYHYFTSKFDILNEIYSQGDEYFEKVVADNLKSGNSMTRIVNFFNYYSDFNISNGIDFLKQLYRSQNKLFIKKNRTMQILLQDIIKEGQEKKEISAEKTASEITDFLFIIVRGVLFDWCLHDGDYDIKKSVSDYINQILIIFKP